MPNSGVLYTPIQINGGTAGKPTELYPRELYITNDGTLYVGDPSKTNNGKIDIIKSVTVDTAKAIKTTNFDTTTKNMSSYSLTSCKLAGCNLNGIFYCKDNPIMGAKLNLSSKSYGTTLPKTANIGDIFILI